MTHLKWKTGKQKKFVKRMVSKANKKQAYKIYRATEKIMKYKHRK